MVRMASAKQVSEAKEAIVEAAFHLVVVNQKHPGSNFAAEAWKDFHIAVRVLGNMATPDER